MLYNIEHHDFFSGFKIANSSIVISHLQYADDTQLFCDADTSQVSQIARFLECCEVTLGIKVNFNKSSIIGTNCITLEVVNLANSIGFKVGSFHVIYLGIPISYSRPSISVWDRIIEQVQVKLALWKPKYLSLGGRVTLLRTCLANLHCKVLLAKYGMDRSQLWLGSNRKQNSSLLWRSLLSRRPMISSYFRWAVGRGEKDSFWHHKWLGDYPLKSTFPDLYNIVTSPNLKVSEAIDRRGKNVSWDIQLAYGRLCNELLGQWCQLMESLDEVYVSINGEDELIWEIESNGLFSVKSCYNLFFYDQWRWSNSNIAQMWKWPIPHKVQIFIWLAAQDKILTVDNLIKRGKILPNVCLLCKKDVKNGAHILIHCPFTTRLWYWLLGMVGVLIYHNQ
ncbi:hypothetical protein AMTRI_Chr02g211910 [Amborella trichopoda]